MGKDDSKKTRRSPRAGRGEQPQRPRSLQVGALCWRRTKKGALRVLLITSRDTGRWVIPKGWPMRNRTPAQAAEREAWEEAGVTGDISPWHLGYYRYPKIMPKGAPIPCTVRVYPLEVQARDDAFPEAGQRRAKWFSPAKAARRVQEPELARIIRDFEPPTFGELARAEAPEDELPEDEGDGTA